MKEGVNNRSPVKKLACVATSSAKLTKIELWLRALLIAEKVYFFNLLLCIFELWLAEGSPPSLLLIQHTAASVAELFILKE